MNLPPSQIMRGNNFARPVARAASITHPVVARPAFYLALLFVFIVYARFPEIMDMVTGSTVHSVRIIMFLSLLAILLFGGDIRAAFSKIGICLIAFTLWMCACVPFSVWRGGSVKMLKDFWLMSICSFVIVACSAQGLEQCRKMMYALAAATIFIEIFTLVTGRAQEGRISLAGGTLGNANYLALMLLMGAPFCLFVMRTKPGLSALKLACLLIVLCIPVTVASTGSRGGLVTLGVMFILYFIPLPTSQKAVVALVALILAVVSIAFSTRSALDRFKTIFSSSTARVSISEQSAVESMELRKELLLSSLQLTMRHPLFGVGPGMFVVANANYVEETTGHPNANAWHETHNTFTQLSCEDGLPGLFLYCLAMLFCFTSVRAAEKRARPYPSGPMVRQMAFALQLALVAFTGTAIFASNAYMYYFPMLAALCVALERATAMQLLALAPGEIPGIRPISEPVSVMKRFRTQPPAAGPRLVPKTPTFR